MSRTLHREHETHRDNGCTHCPDCGVSLIAPAEVEALLQEQMHSLQDAYVRGAARAPLTSTRYAWEPREDEDYYDLGDAYDAEYEAQQADKAADAYEAWYDGMWA